MTARMNQTVPDDECCTGMDVPYSPWTADDVAFWTGNKRYQPWKDVTAFFRPPIEDAGHE